MKPKPVAWLLTATVVVAVMAGCQPPNPPEMAVLGLNEVQPDLLGSTAALRVRISNPHPDPVRLLGVQVTLTAGGSTFARGSGPVEQVLPAFGSTEVEVPVTVSHLALLRGAVGAGGAGRIEHRFDGRVTYEFDGARHTARIEQRGDLPLQAGQGRLPLQVAPVP